MGWFWGGSSRVRLSKNPRFQQFHLHVWLEITWNLCGWCEFSKLIKLDHWYSIPKSVYWNHEVLSVVNSTTISYNVPLVRGKRPLVSGRAVLETISGSYRLTSIVFRRIWEILKDYLISSVFGAIWVKLSPIWDHRTLSSRALWAGAASSWAGSVPVCFFS